jgi:hypothetical protein
MNPLSELAWHLEDYRAADIDPPARCVTNPDKTEGEMMNDEEIEEFIKDSIATLRILADNTSARYEQIKDIYIADLGYLAQVGQISEDDYNDLTHPDNLHFNAEI